jgi:Fe-S cluster assembly protein SufD
MTTVMEKDFRGTETQIVVLDSLPEQWIARVGRDTNVHIFLPIFGGDDMAHQVTIRLMEPGASARVTGIFLGTGQEKLKLSVDTIHEAPHTTGWTNVRAALAESSQLDFSGMIKIHEGAQGSNDFLEQRSLLLSPDAKAVAIPALEIEANEVKASHAVAAGPIDPEHLFYLQTRGLPTLQARQLLIRGFVETLLRSFPAQAQTTMLAKLDTLTA